MQPDAQRALVVLLVARRGDTRGGLPEHRYSGITPKPRL